MLITRRDELKKVSEQLRAHGRFALDTEFERERTYWPRLQLIQVGIPGLVAAIDPLAIDEMPEFLDLLTDPNVVKVMHAGRQDAEIFYRHLHQPMRNIFDTQIAAALLGMGEQIGYANLVQRLLDVRLKKTERITDWGRRPLSDAQLEYALDDVRYPLDIHDILLEKTKKRDRGLWLEEELAFYENPARFTVDPDRLYTRVSGWRSLNRRGLAVLRNLARWREEEAASRDIPKNRVVGDDVLVEIANRQPAEIKDLRPLRRLHPRELERSGNALLQAVKEALALSDAELPVTPKASHKDADAALMADLLGVLLRKRAREHEIAPSYLGTQKALGDLVSWFANGDNEETPRLMEGWRRRLVGDDLQALFRGELRLRIDTDRGRVVSEPTR